MPILTPQHKPSCGSQRYPSFPILSLIAGVYRIPTSTFVPPSMAEAVGGTVMLLASSIICRRYSLYFIEIAIRIANAEAIPKTREAGEELAGRC